MCMTLPLHQHSTEWLEEARFEDAWGTDLQLMAELTARIREAQELDRKLVEHDCTH